MEEKKVSTLFEEIKDDVSHYISDTLELGKLEVYEKLSLGSSVITYSLIIAGTALFALLFVFITLGLYLAEVLDSDWGGFGIVALVAVLFVIILMLAGKPFKNLVTNSVVRFLMAKDDKDDKTQ